MVGSRRAILVFAHAAAFAGVVVVPGGCDDGRPASATAAGAMPASAVSQEKVQASLAAAEEYFLGGRLVEAEAILVRLIDQAPTDPRAPELYGRVLVGRAIEAQANGNAEAAGEAYRKAYEQYRDATQRDPDSAGLRHSAGMIAMTAGLPAEALRHFEAAAAIDPSSPQHPLFSAQLHIQQGAYDEAEAALRQVIDVAPTEPLAWASLAVVAMERGDFETAIEHIGHARDLAPRDLNVRVTEAKIHRRRGEPARALEGLVGLPDDERARAAVTYEIAEACTMLGLHGKAAAAWAHRFSARPEAADAWRTALHAGRAMLEAGDAVEAQRWLDEARARAGEMPEVQDLRRAIAATLAGVDDA